MLRMEFGLRSIALYMGSIISILSLYCSLVVLFSGVKRFEELIVEVEKDKIGLSIFLNCFLIILLTSIFILIATRKFKELNILIKEQKKL